MKIHSIFESISGEGGFFSQGTWCTFIRMQGCNLRCSWCDTKQAQEEGELELPDYQIVERVKTTHVIITGGEPLNQPIELARLANALFRPYTQVQKIQVETNGSFLPPKIKSLYDWTERIYWVVDYKLPSSGMMVYMPPVKEFVEAWIRLRAKVKFVIDTSSDCDLSSAIDIMKVMIRCGYTHEFLLSPVDAQGQQIVRMASALRFHGLLDRIVFSIQLHKLTNQP